MTAQQKFSVEIRSHSQPLKVVYGEDCDQFIIDENKELPETAMSRLNQKLSQSLTKWGEKRVKRAIANGWE
jgi:hypothetical protein